jgi:hypothetical protein
VIIAEGGRSWPPAEGQHPCGTAWNDVCGFDDVDAWAKRLKAEIQAVSSHVGELQPGGEWIGPSAPELASAMAAWSIEAREWTKSGYWESAAGLAALATTYNGYLGVIEEICTRIEAGIALNNAARAMVWEASHKPPPEPEPGPDPVPEPSPPPPAPEPPPLIQCPEGYTPVWVTGPAGIVIQMCQGRGDKPVTQEEAAQGEGHDESGGGGALVLIGVAAAVGAFFLYTRRGSISGRILSSLR